MGFAVESHRPRAFARGDVLDDGEVRRRILVHDGERGALPIRSERVAGAGVKPRCVYAFADRQRSDDFARIRVHDRHQFIFAAGEEPPVHAIHRQA